MKLNSIALSLGLASISMSQASSGAIPSTPTYHCYMQQNAQQSNPRVTFDIATNAPGTQTKSFGEYVATFSRTEGVDSDGSYDLIVTLDKKSGGSSSEMGFAVGYKWIQLNLGKGGAANGDVLLACSTWGE
jgi:hypothetical protein